MFSEAVDELAGQGGGELEELIGVEERSLCGVQTDSGATEEGGRAVLALQRVDVVTAEPLVMVAQV